MTRRALFALLLAAPAWAQEAAPTPPAAKKVPHTTRVHGETLHDDYFWLRERKSSEVLAHLEAENAYTEALTRYLRPMQETLYRELLGRVEQTDLTVPTRDRGYFYYSRSEEGKQYPIVCRKKGSLDGPEEVLIDGNELARGQKFFRLASTAVSDDGSRVAFSTDLTAFRELYFSVKDLATGKLIENRSRKGSQLVWAADGKTLFYVADDHAKRPYRLYRHVVGSDQDDLVYEEKDELFRVGVGRTRDRKYLTITSRSSRTAEVRYLPTASPAETPKLLRPRKEGVLYSVDHRDGLFYIRTNEGGARNFKLVTAPVERPNEWTELIAHRPEVTLNSVILFKDHAVLQERQDGLPHLAVRELAGGATHRISVPEPVYSIAPAGNPEYDTATFRFSYHSMVTPSSVYEYDMKTRQRTLLKSDTVKGYDPRTYRSERVFAAARDGTRVPISLVYRKDTRRDGKAPCLLAGYGSYGSSSPVTFSPANLSLLDRGLVVAWAHIRGGGDMGETWHADGRVLRKKNTFTDFIACADHLVGQKYTAHDRLAIQGGSAGGLLIGAVLNLRPDLCKVAVLNVPFVDVLNTMLDPSVPLTVPEYLEWGNPNVKAEYDYMKSYCPYTNLKATAYPSILVTTSLNDSQVMYWEPAKYVAKLRTLKTDRNPLLLKVNMAGGHAGASGRYDSWRERALTTAFVLDQLGVRD